MDGAGGTTERAAGSNTQRSALESDRETRVRPECSEQRHTDRAGDLGGAEPARGRAPDHQFDGDLVTDETADDTPRRGATTDRGRRDQHDEIRIGATTTVSEIRRNADWRRVFDALGLVRDERRSKVDDWWASSPFAEDRQASFHVTDKGWYCFSSGQGGGALELVQALQGLDWYVAARWLLDTGLSRSDARGGRAEPAPLPEPAVPAETANRPIRQDLVPRLETDHPELARRGISPSTSAYLGCGYLPEGGKSPLSGRIVFQVRGIQNGEPVILSHLGRALSAELEAMNAKLKKGGKKLAVGRPTAFYLPAWEEEDYAIAQANEPLEADGRFANDRVQVTLQGEFSAKPRETVHFMDVSPKQLVSVAAALIPFLEHDDANRALMGSNMQRQSVPLLRTEPPIVGTGLEGVVARDSGAVVLCKRDGIVDTVDARRIIVRVEGIGPDGKPREFGADIYPLLKFRRSNQNTCINQKPIVKEGQRVRAGEVLADGPCTSGGELALGRNILVAFMPWRGYNFEDSILISEKMVKEDYYTSIHIEEFEIEARETKLGPEEITKDIPNVSEHALRDLDESGIIRIGANVKPGDILVGKVTPKGETQLTPEEKLLRAIFGEKAGDVRDASLKCPPGIEGVVVDVKIFTRKDDEKQKDVRAKQILDEEIGFLNKDAEDEIRIVRTEAKEKIERLLEGRTVLEDVVDPQGNVLVAANHKLTVEKIGMMGPRLLKSLKLRDEEIKDTVRLVLQRADSQVDVIRKVAADRVTLLSKGDELAPGVNKTVKVYVAMKRKLQVGDKMAGRHGNKGVISRILPEEDMPYLPDGTPVQIVLNPLGVPSRMNVGQILETHLGWAAQALGLSIASPVFDGASEEEIRALLEYVDRNREQRRDLDRAQPERSVGEGGALDRYRRRQDRHGIGRNPHEADMAEIGDVGIAHEDLEPDHRDQVDEEGHEQPLVVGRGEFPDHQPGDDDAQHQHRRPGERAFRDGHDFSPKSGR